MPAQAGLIVASHIGNTDPESEGWTPNQDPHPDAPFGGVTEGAEYGSLEAWLVDDASPTNNAGRLYQDFLTDDEFAAAQLYGWTLRGHLRLLDAPDEPKGSVRLTFDFGTTGYEIRLGAEADGDPIVTLPGPGNNPLALAGLGAGYHLYELTFVPLISSATLFVDGVEQLENYTGQVLSKSTAPRVRFGAGSSDDTGAAHYHLVQLEIHQPIPSVPEPSSLALLSVSILCLVSVYCYRRRKTDCIQ